MLQLSVVTVNILVSWQIKYLVDVESATVPLSESAAFVVVFFAENDKTLITITDVIVINTTFHKSLTS